MQKGEERFYFKIKEALEEEFRFSKEVYFEITHKKKPSNKIKKHLGDLALYAVNIERLYPDITGYAVVSSPELFKNLETRLIVAEVKSKVKLKDIYQAKCYGEIFNAYYIFIIHIEPLSEEIRRFLKNRPEVLSYCAGYRNIYLSRFDKGSKKIDWYFRKPF